jgi:biopolymer transport protein ExbD
MQSRRHAPESEETGIDLAPMLDFTVNLLIFFIITTSFIKEAGITVFKPEAVTAENRQSGNLLIAIRENGDIWMDRRRIQLREVRTLMERLHIERPDDTVVIIADRASNAGVVAEVMDEVRLAGITTISIAADPGAGG